MVMLSWISKHPMRQTSLRFVFVRKGRLLFMFLVSPPGWLQRLGWRWCPKWFAVFSGQKEDAWGVQRVSSVMSEFLICISVHGCVLAEGAGGRWDNLWLCGRASWMDQAEIRNSCFRQCYVQRAILDTGSTLLLVSYLAVGGDSRVRLRRLAYQ